MDANKQMIKDYYSEILRQIQDQIKVQNWRKAHQLIVAELNLPYVPAAFAAQLKTVLKIVRPHLITSRRPEVMPPDQIFKLLVNDNIDSEMGIGLTHQLQNGNLQPVLATIQKLLVDPNFNPVFKTHLCLLLKRQNIPQAMVLEKFNQLHQVQPLAIKTFAEHDNISKTMRMLKDKLTNYEVTIYDFALKILRCYFDFAFPQLDLITKPALAAATIYVLAQKSLGITTQVAQVSVKFGVKNDCLAHAVQHGRPIMRQGG